MKKCSPFIYLGLILTLVLASCATPTTPIAGRPTEPVAIATATPATSATPVPPAQDDPECVYGAIIECEHQTVRQAVWVTGTSFSLYYGSDRVSGRKTGQTWDARSQGLGGWTLSIHHAYEPVSKILYQGDGERRRVEATVALPGVPANDIIIAAEDGSELYQFDATGRHVRTLDALIGIERYQFTYDSTGQLMEVQDSDNQITTIEREADGTPTAIVSPFGHRTVLRLDPHGYLASIANPAEAVIRIESSRDGLLTTLTDPEGNVSRFGYDAQGRLTHVEHPNGGSTTLARTDTVSGYTITRTTSLGRVSTYTVERLSAGAVRRTRIDPDGTRTEEVIDAGGSRTATYPDGTRLAVHWGTDPRWGMQVPILKHLTQTMPGGLTTTITGDRTVTLATPTDPSSLQILTDILTINDRAFTSQYDVASRTLTTTTPMGRRTITTFDERGRVIEEQIADLLPAHYDYDDRGRLTNIIQGTGPDARTVRLRYNDDDGSLHITDPLGRTQVIQYDITGRMIQETLPDGQIIRYSYDANGNITSVTPPGQATHSFTYAADGLPATYAPPDVGAGSTQTHYTYNADRQLTGIARPDGKSVDLSYDSAGRLNTVTLPRGIMTASYDATTGLLTSITAPSGSELTYRYTEGLLTDEVWEGIVAGNVSHSYDDSLRLTSQDINDSSAVTFQYDDDDFLTQAGDLILRRAAENGLVTSATLGSVISTWSYNGFGEPINLSVVSGDTPLLAIQYTRDKLGRITEQMETIGGATHTYAYSYDQAGRLTEVRKDDTITHTYTYDSNGNRVSHIGPSGTISGTYDAQDRLIQYGDATYEYTANGELLSKMVGDQTTRYEYDELGNLLAVTLPTGAEIDYLTDGQNRRIGKQVDGTLTQSFLYADGLRPIAELDGDSNVVSRFVYASGNNVPDYMVKGDVTYRILTDHLGSPRLIVNVATGEVVQRMDYGPFGNVTQDANPGFQPFGFAGGLYDRDTKLVRFGARDYDAEVGKWAAKDPIGFAGGDTNLYGYVQNNSVNWVDPRGLDNPACDVPDLFFAGLANYGGAECVLECCALHDYCYDVYTCTMKSWLPEVERGQCFECNVDVVFCITGCLLGREPSPNLANYYCNKTNRPDVQYRWSHSPMPWCMEAPPSPPPPSPSPPSPNPVDAGVVGQHGVPTAEVAETPSAEPAECVAPDPGVGGLRGLGEAVNKAMCDIADELNNASENP